MEELVQTLDLSPNAPYPVSITITPLDPTQPPTIIPGGGTALVQVPDDSPAGTAIMIVTVTMSDGSPFAGQLTLTSSPPDNTLTWDTSEPGNLVLDFSDPEHSVAIGM